VEKFISTVATERTRMTTPLRPRGLRLVIHDGSLALAEVLRQA
jgi:hypothetical protein